MLRAEAGKVFPPRFIPCSPAPCAHRFSTRNFAAGNIAPRFNQPSGFPAARRATARARRPTMGRPRTRACKRAVVE